MTIYKTEARIYSPKVVGDAEKSQKQTSQPLQECEGCVTTECRECESCDCHCDCEAQQDANIRVMRRQSRPCSTWALGTICTVTVGLCFLLAGLLYMATRPEYRTRGGATCRIMYPPDDISNLTIPETVSVNEEEQVEIIEIPQFKGNHHVTVMADFRIHVTAFRDNIDKRCFLMNHTNSLFESPTNLYEFIRDYRSGAHLTQLETIYAKMEVQGHAINVTMMATSIQTHCFQISTFWLHSTEVWEEGTGALVKRSVESPSAKQSIVFFNGKKRVHLDLY